METTETREQTFERGRLAGETANRLHGLEAQYSDLRGTLRDVLTGVTGLQLGMQELSLDAAANAATVVKTAAAVKDAKDTQDAAAKAETEKSGERWTPFGRFIAALSGTGVTAGIIFGFITLSQAKP